MIYLTDTEGFKRENCTIFWYEEVSIGQIDSLENLETFTEKIEKSVTKDRTADKNENGFYLIFSDEKNTKKENELLYIGLAFKQPIMTRISQENGHEKAYNCIIQNHKFANLYVKFGAIISLNKDKEMHVNAEKRLIFDNQPLCNSTNKDKYNGSCALTIKNTDTSKEFRSKPLYQVSI